MTDGSRTYPTVEEHAARLTESLRLAVEIADEACRTAIESYCVRHNDGSHTWYFTTLAAGNEDREYVERAVRYLALRQKLEHHATQPALVRCKP